ncbi:MAG TPA: DNA polymerase III subunit delta', partial [Hyphomicrobiaceae bacterium]|nr:DNA polymerase III subunit delta' [Hyphomicrobiaceae bacterium]
MARAPAQHQDETLPEADRLDGFPHPRETRKLLGHAETERELVQAFATGRMHHAWLIAGPEGIGKATLAYCLARYVLAPRAARDASASTLTIAPDSATARQIRALAHPGLLVLRRPYDLRSKRHAASIPVDEVRRLKAFLGLTAGDDTWRVVIVDAADELNVNAANALLKSLEEPPTRALFLLVASEPSRLLPTVRSRCRRLHLAPLTGTALRQASEAALAAAEMDLPDPDRWPLLERLAEGSVRRALLLAGNGGLELYERIEAVLTALPRLDWPAAHALADQLSQSANEQRFEAFYDLLLEMLWRLVHARALAS